MENLKIYESVRTVPDTAKKPIKGGNINGFTDINPMWRIKKLTELFGPCGVGWYIEPLKQWLETSPDGRIAAFCNINLYIKSDGEWSKPIYGTGGSMFVDLAHDKQKASDECFKMANTDALSVACKCLGIGADVYWEKDSTKYTKPEDKEEPAFKKPVENKWKPPKEQPQPAESNVEYFTCADCGKILEPYTDENGGTVGVRKLDAVTRKKFGRPLCVECAEEAAAKARLMSDGGDVR